MSTEQTVPPDGTVVRCKKGAMVGVLEGTLAIVRHQSPSGHSNLPRAVWLELEHKIRWSHGESEHPGFWGTPAGFTIHAEDVAWSTKPLDLATFLDERLDDLAQDDSSEHLAGALRNVVAAYRVSSDVRTPQMAVAANAIGYSVAAIAEAWATHPDYDEAWRAGR